MTDADLPEDVVEQAKELLAQAFDRSGNQHCADDVRRGRKPGFCTPLWMDEALDAITTALTASRYTEREALVEELGEALDQVANYAEHVVAGFKSGRPYLDMTAFPHLCTKARAALAKLPTAKGLTE